jgi:hypothetical protein
MSQAFEILVAEFAAAKGLQAEPGSYALEFESEDHQVVVMPHPARQDHLMVEVSVAALGQDGLGEDLAPLLLQINEAARFEHEWSIFMDTRMEVTLGTCLASSGLSLAEMEGLIVDGLDRARALRDLLQAQTQQLMGDDAAQAALEVPAGEPAGLLRG